MTDQDFAILKILISLVAFVWLFWYMNNQRAKKIKEFQGELNQAFQRCYKGIDDAFDDFESGMREIRRPVRRVKRPVRRVVIVRKGGRR